MKKQHRSSLKFNAIYSLILSVVFLLIILFAPEMTLGVAMVFLVLYIIGNGIVHTKNNELTRDTLFEYMIVAIIVFVIILGVAR